MRFHSQKAIQGVLNDVLGEGMSIRKAAEKHGIPAPSVQYMVKKVRDARATYSGSAV
jgi:transposase-like protein